MQWQKLQGYINETKNMRIYYIVGFIPQYMFICDDNNNILVDDVVNIKDIDNFLYTKFNIKFNIKINTHNNTNDNYYKYCTEENIKMIKNIYKNDYNL